MNLRRGLFRIWWVLSLLAVLGAEGWVIFLFNAPAYVTGVGPYFRYDLSGALGFAAAALMVPPLACAIPLAALGGALSVLRWFRRGFSERDTQNAAYRRAMMRSKR
jgi:hypothetical protein